MNSVTNHSTLALASGSVCTTDCWHGITVAGVVRSHWVNGTYVSEPQDFRPTSTPAPGLDLAEMLVPPAIQAAGFVGGSVLESRAIMQAGAWQGEGAAAAGKYVGQGISSGDKAIGQGVASVKPPIINTTNINTNSLSSVSSSTSAASAGASAKASASQSQGQLQVQGIRLDPPNDEP